jgi:hypothetical protein
VFVEEELRVPAVVEDAVDRPGLLLGEHIIVAVVVVTHIGMVEPRHVAAFVGRAHVFVVPVDDHHLPVRIDRRHQEEDRGVEPGEHLRVAGGGHAVHEFQGHLGRADLGGVDGTGDHRDGLALRHQRAGLVLGHPLGIGEAAGDLPVAVEVALVRFGGQDHDRHVVAEGRGPGRLDAHPVRGGVDKTQVFDDLRPGCELAVLPNPVAEEAFGRGNLGPRQDGKGQDQDGGG